MSLIELDNMLLEYDDTSYDIGKLNTIIDYAKKIGSIKHMRAAYIELYRVLDCLGVSADALIADAAKSGIAVDFHVNAK